MPTDMKNTSMTGDRFANNKGNSWVILVILLIVVLGYAGYATYHHSMNDSTTQMTNSTVMKTTNP